MNLDFLRFMTDMELGQSSSKEALDNIEESLQIVLPDEYREFMVEHNGAEGAIGENNYLVIWPVEEVVELNEAYGVSDFTPSLVYFGSDGGGVAYAFDKRTVPINIVKFPFDSIHIEDAEQVANSFGEFIKAIHDE